MIVTEIQRLIVCLMQMVFYWKTMIGRQFLKKKSRTKKKYHHFFILDGDYKCWTNECVLFSANMFVRLILCVCFN